MSDYIKREDTIKHLRKVEALYRRTMESQVRADMIAHCVNIIDGLPSADVVEVVRCRDCVKWIRFKGPDNGNGYCRYGLVSAEDGYCFKGNRRPYNG